MYIAHRWIDRNLTRLELIVAVTLIAIFIGYFLRQTDRLLDSAEQRLVDNTIANVQTALSLQAAIYQARGDRASLSAMNGMNPFSLMRASPADLGEYVGTALEGVKARQYAVNTPANYAGVIDPDANDGLLPGKWYFDAASRELIYSPRMTAGGLLPWEHAPLLRFTVRVEFDDRGGDNVYNPDEDGTAVVRLVELSAPSMPDSQQLKANRGES